MSGHEMRYAAKWKVGTRFFEQGIWLYIDARFTPMNRRFICTLGNEFPAGDGDYGGGEETDGITWEKDPFREHCGWDNCALQTGLPWYERENTLDYCDDCWNDFKLYFSF